ncbi:MAG: PAS domain S-box protein [Deltaproteobacteria bacterium]|nr:PAS domain S-box protein [Deltaproteobacteria bacterium]
MKDENKKKSKPIEALAVLRQRIKKLEALEKEHARAEEALRESEERFRQIYDETPIGYHELDTGGRIIRVNRTELEMLGYTVEEMLGQPVWKFVLEDETTRHVVMAKITGDVSFHETFERTYWRKDGTTLPVLVKDRVIRDKGGQIIGIRSTVEDITERRRSEEALRKSEEQLRQWQKVEAIGRLAGGIAHDFNNLLMTIKGCSEILLQECDAQDPRSEEAEEIQKAAERATSLTRQLLAFGRRQILQPQVLNLNKVVANMNKMLQRVIGEDIQLLTVLEPKLGPMKVDPGQIEQVIMNLAVNARDAMPRGGKLTIETANVLLDEDYAQRHVSVKPGSYVMLAVSDNGCGMDKETQSHLFEPFFTTKEKGKGTGLGLSTVYGIVKQSGGNIWAYSEVGQGTTFKIYLPMVIQAVKEKYEPVERRRISTRGKETILVVEDEKAVRKMIRKTLQNKGYTVLEAQHGQEALDVCEHYSGPIHLMVTDVVMPQMSGKELAEKLAPSRREMQVLYMSGYPDNSIVQHGVLESGTEFLQKPFTLNTLEAKVRKLLDARLPKMKL